MKHAPLFFSLLALLGVVIIGALVPLSLPRPGTASPQAPAASPGAPVALVNMDTLTSQVGAFKQLDSLLTGQRKLAEQQMMGMLQRFQAAVGQYQQQAEAMSPAQRQQVEQQLTAQQGQLESMRSQQAQFLQAQETQKEDSLYRWLRGHLEDFRQQGGYTLILSTRQAGGAVLAGAPGLDVTDQVVRRLNGQK